MAKLKRQLKKNVMVKVLAGKERGKTGKVISIDKKRGKVLIEKLNLQKRHAKPTEQNRHGGIIEKEGAIHVSNVYVIEESAEKKPVKSKKETSTSKRKKS